MVGEEDEQKELPFRHFPRSAESFSCILDQLDRDLEEEEGEEEEGGEEQSSSIVLSHPLDFHEQFSRITIVTTASLPWLTGTAVNPALRAAYLWKAGHSVTLLVPFIVPEEQGLVFADNVRFQRPEDQVAAVADCIQRRVPFPIPLSENTANDESLGFRLRFYPAKYDPALGSIIPDGDIQPLVPVPVDCIVLEEPEHLTWHHAGRRWTRAFEPHVPVVGVIHTNYVDYARRMAGDRAAGTLRRLNKFLCRQHTHKVIKLSDAVQELPRQETCFVHGVSHSFLNQRAAPASDSGESTLVPFTKGAYFIGKALWAKGFAELLDQMEEHRKRHEMLEKRDSIQIADKAVKDARTVDVYGSGPQLKAIKKESYRRKLDGWLRFLGPMDHLADEIKEYRAFINPSTSDVVATTSAEALAMGKWLVVPRHPCNEFFSSFTNCLVYSSSEEFSMALDTALSKDPAPLSDEERQKLSWEAATDRFLHCCASVDVSRGAAFERVAAKTGWLGYNVGYQVYSVVTGALDLVRKGMQQQQDDDDDDDDVNDDINERDNDEGNKSKGNKSKGNKSKGNKLSINALQLPRSHCLGKAD